MRVFLGVLVIVAALLVGTFFYLSVPDIPRSVLEAKYATPPSQFLTLADGARVHYRDQVRRMLQSSSLSTAQMLRCSLGNLGSRDWATPIASSPWICPATD